MSRRVITWLLPAIAAVVACGPEEKIEATGPPEVGTVRVHIVSTFGIDDEAPGIDLPGKMQVWVYDGVDEALPDAEVRVYPGGEHPEPMVHQGGGRYEVDVLPSRVSPPEEVYFFEVESEFLEPPRVVLRVEHEFLEEQPEIGEPEERSEHPEGEALSVTWFPVEGADCYDVGVREHELQNPPTWVHECIDSTTAAIDGEALREYVRVRARRSVGDEEFIESDVYSLSTSSTEVRIFLVRPGD